MCSFCLILNILAVGAHWDDIELGCGLTLNRLSQQGHTVYTVVICSSQYGKEINEGMTESKALENGLKSFSILNANYIETSKEPNSNLVYSKKIMQILESISIDKNIDTVFTHWFGDINTDHRSTWEISRTAFRNVKNFLMYQSNAYDDHVNTFKPNFFMSFKENEYLLKEKILSQYDSEWERRKNRWKREIFDREKYWGFLSGSDYAEAFQISKLVNFYPQVVR